MIIYGGYILTGGTLDNGQKWKGVTVMLADSGKYDMPVSASCCKGQLSDSLLDTLHNLPIGCPVVANFGMPTIKDGRQVPGKLISLEPLKK